GRAWERRINGLQTLSADAFASPARPGGVPIEGSGQLGWPGPRQSFVAAAYPPVPTIPRQGASDRLFWTGVSGQGEHRIFCGVSKNRTSVPWPWPVLSRKEVLSRAPHGVGSSSLQSRAWTIHCMSMHGDIYMLLFQVNTRLMGATYEKTFHRLQRENIY